MLGLGLNLQLQVLVLYSDLFLEQINLFGKQLQIYFQVHKIVRCPTHRNLDTLNRFHIVFKLPLQRLDSFLNPQVLVRFATNFMPKGDDMIA